jgi:hypothetical protein
MSDVPSSDYDTESDKPGDPKAPPLYEALSYIWDSVTGLHTIKVLGPPLDSQSSSHAAYQSSDARGVTKGCFTTLGITQNLALALRHLRDSQRPRILWIDAICINQNDLPERSAEVRRMGDIYSTAWGVLV